MGRMTGSGLLPLLHTLNSKRKPSTPERVVSFMNLFDPRSAKKPALHTLLPRAEIAWSWPLFFWSSLAAPEISRSLLPLKISGQSPKVLTLPAWLKNRPLKPDLTESWLHPLHTPLTPVVDRARKMKS